MSKKIFYRSSSIKKRKTLILISTNLLKSFFSNIQVSDRISEKKKLFPSFFQEMSQLLLFSYLTFKKFINNL